MQTQVRIFVLLLLQFFSLMANVNSCDRLVLSVNIDTFLAITPCRFPIQYKQHYVFWPVFNTAVAPVKSAYIVNINFDIHHKINKAC